MTHDNILHYLSNDDYIFDSSDSIEAELNEYEAKIRAISAEEIRSDERKKFEEWLSTLSYETILNYWIHSNFLEEYERWVQGMTDIELVIKIPEKTYKATCNGSMLPPDVDNVINAIKNATQLPKCKEEDQ